MLKKLLHKLIPNKSSKKNKKESNEDQEVNTLRSELNKARKKLDHLKNNVSYDDNSNQYYIEKKAVENALDLYDERKDRLTDSLHDRHDRLRELMGFTVYNNDPRENKVSIDERNLLNSKLNYFMDRLLMLAKEGKKRELKDESLRIEKEIRNDPDFILETADNYIDWFDDNMLKNYRERRPDKLWWFRAFNIYKKKMKKTEKKEDTNKREEKAELQRMFDENNISVDKDEEKSSETSKKKKSEGSIQPGLKNDGSPNM